MDANQTIRISYVRQFFNFSMLIGMVQNAFVRLVNLANNQELAKYNLSGSEYQGATGMIMAEIYRHNNEWKMAAIGDGLRVDGLKGLVQTYS